MAVAEIGYGAELRVGATTAATSATVVLGGVKNLPPPPFTRDLIDVTSNTSPNATREFIPGLKDPGELSFEINWVPGNSTDAVFQAMLLEQDPRVFEVRYTQVTPNVAFTFSAFLTGYEADAPMDDAMTASVTLKVTGAVVIS